MANKIDAKIQLKTDGTGKVIADVQKVTDNVKKSASSVDLLKKKLNSISIASKISAVSSAMNIVGSSFGGLVNIIGSVTRAIDGFATKTDGIAKFSKTIGMSSAQLQKWQYAAERGGMSSEKMNDALKKFSINVSKAANGEKKQLAIFNALGISLKKTNGETKSTNELMLEMADAYNKVQNSQDRMRLTSELFGKNAMDIINVLGGGSSAVNELFARRERFGGLLTKEDAENAEKFKDLLLDVKEVRDAIGQQMMDRLLPSLSTAFEEFLSWWDVNGEEVLKNVKTAVDVVIFSVKDLYDWFNKTYHVVTEFPDVIKGIKISYFSWLDETNEKFRNGQKAVRDMISMSFDFWTGKISSSISKAFHKLKAELYSISASAAEALSKIPVVGGQYEVIAKQLRVQAAQEQKSDPNIVESANNYSSGGNAKKTGTIDVNFSGIPAGTSIMKSDEIKEESVGNTSNYTFSY